MRDHLLLLFIMNITEFQTKVSQAEKPIVVDFWASWCSPCKITKPILEKVAKEYKDKVEFMPIDVDESHEVLEHFKIIGIPTVLAVHYGEVSARITGAQNETSYRAMFEALAEGRDMKMPMSTLDRMLRLGAGAMLVMYGVSTSNWLVLGIGGMIAFLGIYDRCPIWNAITGMIQAKTKN
ncbi:MAG TPA: thioredoxin [Anaerolineales bacterium]|nr:thioredoxin [Anaerolineales bacterium]